jgi:hypothetical protein
MKGRLLDRNSARAFLDQLRAARLNALHDSENFDGIIHVIERLGSFLAEEMKDLGKYEEHLLTLAASSALAVDVPVRQREFHISFSMLYDSVRRERNDALHQGAVARRLTAHAIELSLVLEDALKQKINATVGDYMVRTPICAEMWQPISFIRQQMLANSFSFLPVMKNEVWHLISDIEIATYLVTAKERNERLTKTLEEAKLPLREAKICSTETALVIALEMMAEDQQPLLVIAKAGRDGPLVGIVTPFDLL